MRERELERERDRERERERGKRKWEKDLESSLYSLNRNHLKRLKYWSCAQKKGEK